MLQQPRHTRCEGNVEPGVLERGGLLGKRGSDPFRVGVRHQRVEPSTVLAQQRHVGNQSDVRGHGPCGLDRVLPAHCLRDSAVALQ